MNTVKVSITDLLRTLEKNRSEHIQEFGEAMEGYKVSMQKELLGKVKTLKKLGKVSHSFNTVVPVSYEKDFDEAIAQLEWSVDKEVLLTAGEFKQLVLNEWSWQNSFKTTVGMYKGK
jgi:hypothetical protein